MYVHIKKLSDDKGLMTCVMPEDLFESLNLFMGVLYTINFGGVSHKAFVGTCKPDGNYMYFSGKLLNKLALPAGITINIWKKGEEINLGPVVGVFVNTRFLGRFETGCPYKVSEENARASQAANSFCYYFSINNIDWARKKIKGYWLLACSGKWKCSWFPFPNVIYDRGVNFTAEQNPLVERFWELMKEDPGIHLINNKHRLEKWEIHKGLVKYPKMNRYLPETVLYEDFEDVEKMLNKHKFIFIKSSLGSKGKEVLSIEKVENGYRLVFYNRGLISVDVSDMENVKEYVSAFIEGKEFIVQQGIRLIKHLGRNMDLRILIIKNEMGKWDAVNYYCRFAKDSLTITNTSVGGDIKNYEDIYPLLKSSLGEGIVPTKEALKKIAIDIAHHIERDHGTMGEIGMDLAIDEGGNIWFIEANGKPDKALNEEVDDIQGISPKALAVFKYAKYLAEKDVAGRNKMKLPRYNEGRIPSYYLPGK